MKFALTCLLALMLSGTAQAARQESLDRVASVFAMRPVTISCSRVSEDFNLSDSWGYTYLISDEATLRQALCDSISSSRAPLWKQAVGILVLTHESYHMRLWDLRADEAAVECKAIRHFTVSAAMFGYTPEKIELLKPWALMAHWRIAAKAPQYHSKTCKVPNPWK